jgi:cell division protein FtsW
MKIVIPLFFVHWIGSLSDRPSLLSFVRILGWMMIPLGLIVVEPDNGTTLFLLALIVMLLFLSRLPWAYWVLPLTVIGIGGGSIAWQMPHARARIQTYLHPEEDLLGKGHQPHQAKIAAGSGGWWGKGFGESLQKLNYLPEARSDYIGAIYAEELGFIGILVLIALYLLFGIGGFCIAFRSTHLEGFLLASIYTLSILFQALLNLGIVSGLLPSKGMTLPFCSQGGTSLLVNLTLLAFLLDIGSIQRER